MNRWRRLPAGVRTGVGLGLCFLLVLGIVAWRQSPVPPTQGGTLVFQDDFERAEPGPDYRQGEPDPGNSKGTWRIEQGRLKAEKIHNAALWLQKELPPKVRIEFDARAESGTGDVKAEVFGDGITHQSGYILIHGGWSNTITTIARQDEHAEERKVDNRGCRRGRGQRDACVEPGVDYHWIIERDGDTVRWFLDGQLLLTYPDADPVLGKHLAFNNWEAPVTFDNLRIYAL
ncbi:MAG: hypothetical protein H6706_01760 [Myxococcales bacterium]|nr:hypothetical protein [Myxococcales bacterium]